MIKIQKEYDGKYIAFNDKTYACADIIRIDGGYSAYGRSKVQYRVDYQGCTKLSMVTLTEAKSYARKLVK